MPLVICSTRSGFRIARCRCRCPPSSPMTMSKTWSSPCAGRWRTSPADLPRGGEMAETVLVTGGVGFIGSCFVRQLLAEQQTHVVNLDKLTYAGNRDSLASVWNNPLHHFEQGDIGD